LLGELFRPKKDADLDRDSLREILSSDELDVARDVRRIMLNVLDVHDRVVREIMVPRIDMKTVSEKSGLDEVIETVRKCGHSRIPLIAGDADSVVGILYARDFITETLQKEEVDLKKRSRDVFFVPETKGVLDLFDDFRKRRIHIAIVVDEYGGVSGLVSMEDILESLVGDIRDEYDSDRDSIIKEGRSGWSVDAREAVSVVNEQCDTLFPEDQADTIGGLVLELFGSLPSQGETVSSSGYRLKVLRIKENRIQRIHLSRERKTTSSS